MGAGSSMSTGMSDEQVRYRALRVVHLTYRLTAIAHRTHRTQRTHATDTPPPLPPPQLHTAPINNPRTGRPLGSPTRSWSDDGGGRMGSVPDGRDAEVEFASQLFDSLAAGNSTALGALLGEASPQGGVDPRHLSLRHVGRTVLHEAAQLGLVHVVEQVVRHVETHFGEAGVKRAVNEPDARGQTPLYLSLEQATPGSPSPRSEAGVRPHAVSKTLMALTVTLPLHRH